MAHFCFGSCQNRKKTIKRNSRESFFLPSRFCAVHSLTSTELSAEKRLHNMEIVMENTARCQSNKDRHSITLFCVVVIVVLSLNDAEWVTNDVIFKIKLSKCLAFVASHYFFLAGCMCVVVAIADAVAVAVALRLTVVHLYTMENGKTLPTSKHQPTISHLQNEKWLWHFTSHCHWKSSGAPSDLPASL